MPTMNAVSASELAHLRSDAAAAVCDLPCTLSRKGARVPTAQGGNASSYSVVLPPYGTGAYGMGPYGIGVYGRGTAPSGLLAGLSKPTASMLTTYGYLIGSRAAFVAHWPSGTEVREKDRATIAGETMEVIRVLQPSSYSALTNALCVEVKG